MSHQINCSLIHSCYSKVIILCKTSFRLHNCFTNRNCLDATLSDPQKGEYLCYFTNLLFIELVITSYANYVDEEILIKHFPLCSGILIFYMLFIVLSVSCSIRAAKDLISLRAYAD